MNDAWKQELDTIPFLRIKWNEPLARFTSFKIGGPADALVWADSREQLAAIAAVVRKHTLRLLPIGRGTNLLIGDAGFRGIAMKLGRDFETIQFLEDNRVRAGAAVPMSIFSKECAKHGLSGAEFMFGIPGALGGGLRMNAGAHGSDFSAIAAEVEALGWDGEFHRLDHAAMEFQYRTSALGNGEYVCATEAVYALKPEDPAAVEERTKGYYYGRLTTQPLHLPSAGCVFRNPDVGAAGKLIDECGLKGMAVGSVRVSEKHGNYMVASEGATAEDVLKLIEIVRRRIKERFGTDLELEIKIIDA